MNEPKDVCEWSVRKINKFFRENDESNKYPICGRFNATERAIRRLRRNGTTGSLYYGGLEYYLALDREISLIVNDPRL